MKFLDNKTIIACSTGNFTNTAIALIRISGFEKLSDLQIFFDFDLSKTKARYNHLVNIVFNYRIFDNCLLTFYPEGKSFTGENTLELQVHGNKISVQNILNLFIENAGFRLAEPGEFSFRAYKNKKLSLSQVEGLDLFLNASSSLMLEQGLDILQGQLHKSYLDLYDIFLRLKSSVELLIDFSEDVGEEYAKESYFKLFNDLTKLVDYLNLRIQGDASSLVNPEVVIVGETNTGKSSFFNHLLKSDRSIISNIKGTTRDYVSESISINSTNFVLIDTAGIRETFDEIEKIGISRSFQKINNAFYKILLINPLNFSENYLRKLAHIKFDLILFTHADVAEFHREFSINDFSFLNFQQYNFCSFISGSIGPETKSGSIGPDTKSGSIGPETKSGSIGPETKSGSIGPETKSGSIGPLVFDLIIKKYNSAIESGPLLLERHRNKIKHLHDFIASESNDFNDLSDMAIVSNNINGLGVVIAELIGQISSDDVLNSVFSNFCIGK
jgi:tRNA modification GTPase